MVDGRIDHAVLLLRISSGDRDQGRVFHRLGLLGYRRGRPHSIRSMV